MERKASGLGMNRTGIQTSPVHSKKAIEGASKAQPSSPGDASAIAKVRAELSKELDGLGSVPLPGTLALVRGWLAAGTMLEAKVGQEAAGAPA